MLDKNILNLGQMVQDMINLITNNFEIDDVYDLDYLIDYFQNEYTPDEIFSDDQLEAWAFENGFTRKECE